MAVKSYDLIKNELELKKKLKLTDISNQFGISIMTVNRVIQELESKGIASRNRGGVILIEKIPDHIEIDFDYRTEIESESKLLIAKRAAELVKPNSKIYLDDSSICFYLLDSLGKNVNIYTSSLEISRKACKLGFANIYIVGGKINSSTRGIVHTYDTKIIESQLYDIAFVGVRAFSTSGKIYDSSQEKAEVKEIFMSSSKKVVILANSSKEKNKSFYEFTPNKFTLITNTKSTIKPSLNIEVIKV